MSDDFTPNTTRCPAGVRNIRKNNHINVDDLYMS